MGAEARIQAGAAAAMEGGEGEAQAFEAAEQVRESIDAMETFKKTVESARLMTTVVAAEMYPSPGLEYDASQCLFLLDSASRRLLDFADNGPSAMDGVAVR